MSRSGFADARQTWEYIDEGVRMLMYGDMSSGWLTPQRYMQMYTAIHNFCVSAVSTPTTSASSAPAAVAAAMHDSGVSSGVRVQHTQLTGGELYACLREFLITYLSDIAREASRHRGSQLIEFYNAKWTRYALGAKYLDHIFAYINRYWVKHEREDADRAHHIYEVSTLCLVLWRDTMLVNIRAALVRAILDEISAQRDGLPVNFSHLNLAIQSFVSVGLDEQSTKRTSLAYYVEVFENAFIEATRQYYSHESTQFLSEHGVVPYMKLVDRRLNEEHHRATMYLHPGTEMRLIQVCERVLIESNATELQQEFRGLLAADCQEECHVLFRLLSKVSDGLAPIQQILKEYVETQGFDAVNALIAAQPQGQADSVNPKAYVDTLLSVYDHFAALVQNAFEGAQSMSSAVEQGCESFINRNLIARRVVDPRKGTRATDSRTPELLAKYADSLLKKSSKSLDVQDIEQGLHGIIRLLKFVDEKDLFESHYSRLLSRRLVHQNSAHQELEASMVSRLGELCGYEYANKLQRMFQDINTSQELQQNFHQKQSAGDADFNAFVLAEGFWPLPVKEVPFNVPSTLMPTFEQYGQFYDALHNGRKLKWLWNFGKAELKMNFTKSKSSHILLVSAYQMAILLAYNDKDELTFEELQQLTGLPEQLVAGSLTYIVKAQVLLCSPPDAAVGAPNTSYRLNQGFKSRKVRINLNLPLKVDIKAEDSGTEREIQEHRRLYLQAFMVRIMKTRRTLNHAELVQATSAFASKRFNPTVQDIKRCIALLLEMDYIQRDTDKDCYVYLA